MKILFTHGYFLSEDPKELQIMRPYVPLGILYISAFARQGSGDDSSFLNFWTILPLAPLSLSNGMDIGIGACVAFRFIRWIIDWSRLWVYIFSWVVGRPWSNPSAWNIPPPGFLFVSWSGFGKNGTNWPARSFACAASRWGDGSAIGGLVSFLFYSRTGFSFLLGVFWCFKPGLTIGTSRFVTLGILRQGRNAEHKHQNAKANNLQSLVYHPDNITPTRTKKYAQKKPNLIKI